MPAEFLGPAYVSNTDTTGASSVALMPTLIGQIAQGIMLTDSASERVSMSLDFNCQEESKSNEV